MEEYGDIYYLDDTRNATRDHRPHGGTVAAGYRPASFTPTRPTRTLVAQPPVPAGVYRPAYVPQAPGYPPQAQMVYAQQPIMYGEPSPTAGSLLGRLTIAQLIEIAAQAFAALQSLPPPPNPTQETDTNVQNMIVYQRALAEHAKRDEQIRTLGTLVAKLAG
jgi:hypothetical protein